MSHSFSRRVLAAALFLAAGSRMAAQEPAAPPAGACPVAEDDQYAFTMEHPVQVGGGMMFGDARQRRYIGALRSPSGQPFHIDSIGETQGPDGTILDVYNLSTGGRDKAVSLYLDWYHYNPQRAPKGFTCGTPINLGIPPLDVFLESNSVRAVALAQGAQREFAPIPLDADGPPVHGVLIEQFRMFARAARAAENAGKPLDPRNLSKELAQAATAIVAYPLTCEGRSIAPASIDVIGANGAALPRTAQAPVPDISKALPGINAPAGSVAVMTRLSHPRPNDVVRITYAEACGAAAASVDLPVKITAPRGVDAPMPLLPPGAQADQPMLLQMIIDPDGTMQSVTYIGGRMELLAAATDAVKRWKSEPARINGVPTAAGVLLQVKFAPPAKD